MNHETLPLFAWQPPRKVLLFPTTRRAGKIRTVASKMLDKPTDKSAAHYRNQVTEAMLANFGRLGISEDEQDEQLGAFWDAVQSEMLRQIHFPGRSGDGAA